jgi:hypothetical protein
MACAVNTNARRNDKRHNNTRGLPPYLPEKIKNQPLKNRARANEIMTLAVRSHP